MGAMGFVAGAGAVGKSQAQVAVCKGSVVAPRVVLVGMWAEENVKELEDRGSFEEVNIGKFRGIQLSGFDAVVLSPAPSPLMSPGNPMTVCEPEGIDAGTLKAWISQTSERAPRSRRALCPGAPKRRLRRRQLGADRPIWDAKAATTEWCAAFGQGRMEAVSVKGARQSIEQTLEQRHEQSAELRKLPEVRAELPTLRKRVGTSVEGERKAEEVANADGEQAEIAILDNAAGLVLRAEQQLGQESGERNGSEPPAVSMHRANLEAGDDASHCVQAALVALPKEKRKRIDSNSQSFYSSSWTAPQAQLATALEGPVRGFARRRKCRLNSSTVPATEPERSSDAKRSFRRGLTGAMALDCEWMPVGANGKQTLVRVAVVNSKLQCVYQAWVTPVDQDTGLPIELSGLRSHNNNSEATVSFRTAQSAVAELLQGRLLVGHAVWNDLAALALSHPEHRICELSEIEGIRQSIGHIGNHPSLKRLAAELLGEEIQSGKSHDPIEDAAAAMKLYLLITYGIMRKRMRHKDSEPSVLRQPTEAIALDCEMVGGGETGRRSMLARVALVNSKLECVYHAWVKPVAKVTNYRTAVSGVRPQDIHSENAVPFLEAQQAVKDLLKGRILVGHAAHNDLRVLELGHPKAKSWDSSKASSIRKAAGRSGLKRLAAEVLGEEIQSGKTKNDPVEDATMIMKLYLFFRHRKMQHSQEKEKNLVESTGAEEVAQPAVESKAAPPTKIRKQNSQPKKKKAAQPKKTKKQTSQLKKKKQDSRQKPISSQ